MDVIYWALDPSLKDKLDEEIIARLESAVLKGYKFSYGPFSVENIWEEVNPK